MNRQNGRTIRLLFLLVITFLCTAHAPSTDNSTVENCWQEDQLTETLMVIGNEEGTPKEISFEELIKVMKGQRPRWDDGTKAKIALMKPKTTVGTLTAKKVYGMSATELSKYWVAMVFEGKSSPPEFFSDEADLIKYVNKTEGAIGIISQNQQSVNIILVDGAASI